jgi:hypothetical protein
MSFDFLRHEKIPLPYSIEKHGLLRSTEETGAKPALSARRKVSRSGRKIPVR